MPTTPLCFCFVSASSLFVSQVCTSLDREPAIEVNGADWPVFVITKAFSTFYIFLFYWLFRHLISSVSVQCSSKSSSSETISAQKNCWIEPLPAGAPPMLLSLRLWLCNRRLLTTSGGAILSCQHHPAPQIISLHAYCSMLRQHPVPSDSKDLGNNRQKHTKLLQCSGFHFFALQSKWCTKSGPPRTDNVSRTTIRATIELHCVNTVQCNYTVCIVQVILAYCYSGNETMHSWLHCTWWI